MRRMKPPQLTIEYPVGNRTVRRRLTDKWPCPLCNSRLEPAGDRALGISRLLACPQCGGEFKVVEIEMPEKKPAQPYRGWPAARRAKPGPRKD